MNLRSSILLSVAVVGWSLANLPDAKADLCFRYSTGGGILVAKGVKLIEPGTCQPLALYESQEIGSGGGAANGMICRDEFIIIFHYTYDACIGPGSLFSSATCRLELGHGGTGTLPTIGSGCRVTDGGAATTPHAVLFRNYTDSSMQITECGDMPIPGGSIAHCTINKFGFSHNEAEPEQTREPGRAR